MDRTILVDIVESWVGRFCTADSLVLLGGRTLGPQMLLPLTCRLSTFAVRRHVTSNTNLRFEAENTLRANVTPHYDDETLRLVVLSRCSC